jgi:hypothetical protein
MNAKDNDYPQKIIYQGESLLSILRFLPANAEEFNLYTFSILTILGSQHTVSSSFKSKIILIFHKT